MSKKIIAGLLSLTLAFSCVAIPGENVISDLFGGNQLVANAETSGDFEYEILDDGTVEITGYNGDKTNVTIPSTISGKKVTSVGEWSFCNNTELTTVTIPNGVTTIKIGAFYGCTYLEKISIPASVNTIESAITFFLTPWLNNQCSTNDLIYVNNILLFGQSAKGEITISKGITSISGSAFALSDITKITLPDTLTEIGYGAFEACFKLTSVKLQNGIKIIKSATFSQCENLTSINIPDSVTSIDSSAFGDTAIINNQTSSLKYVDKWLITADKDITSAPIKSGTVGIADETFYWCENLTNITIPDSARSIGYSAFFNCTSLASITIPNNVTNINDYAFGYYYDDKSDYVKIPNFKIRCYSNTAGEQYAKDNGLDYELIGTTTKNMSSCTVSAISSQTYTGSSIKPTITVKDGTKTLVNGTDYTVAYSNNTKVGTATVTITGKGNYTGTITKTFTINAKSITSATVSEISAQTYTGSAIKPAVTVKDGTKTLVNGTDYTVAYSNNTKVGTATVKITGKGNYTGVVTKTFAITAQSITKTAAVSGIVSKTWNGKAQTQAPTVKVGTKTLVNGTDYTISYTSNTAVGKARMVIRGKGNYSGAVVKYFNINPRKQTMKRITAGTKSFRAVWSKVSEATGYQLEYSTSSKFTNSTKTWITSKTSYAKTVSKLSAKKTYYVRVRTYTKVGTTKYYGAWSNAMSVKTK